jgi:diguanylate cyclase (GGDEF)-like protein
MLLRNHPPEILTLIDTPSQLDVAAPIIATASEQPIGWVRLSLNLNQQRENQAFIMQRGILYTVLAVFFGGFIAWLLAQKTARSLQSIQQASQAFAAGDTHARVPEQPFSELQLLAKGMNVLLDTIHLREQELISANDQMTFLAMHDSLTQLANQRAFYDELHQVTKNKPTTNMSLVMIDLDGFKPINDNLGHNAGDAVLVIVAQRLKAFMLQIKGRLTARLGGDEFTLIIMHTDGLAEDLEKLRAQLAESYIVDDRTIGGVSASIGAVFCTQGESINEMNLLKLADKAMYEAKNNGRDRVVVVNCSQA